jgi:aminoglycoside phosphotransferase (APT) family kinase protein
MSAHPSTDDRPPSGRLVDLVDTAEEARSHAVAPLLIRERLEDVLPGAGPLTVRRLGEGHSNVTFLVRRGDAEWVLRRPPRPPYAEKAHDVLREHAILRALTGTGVPAPAPILACADLDVIGAPFYLMEHLPGHAIRDAVPAALDGPDTRVAIAGELVDRLVDLHAVPWRETAFPVRGDGTGYLARQLALWRAQWDGIDGRAVPGIPEAHALLVADLPASPAPTIVHGDYKIDNVLFGVAPPARIVAILDWEMATVGDPLADLGFLAASWLDPGESPDRLLGLGSATAEPGFPDRRWLVDRYADRSGRDVSAVDWYRALALWKLAVLLEGSYQRYLRGTDDDPFFATLRDGVPHLADQALAALRP